MDKLLKLFTDIIIGNDETILFEDFFESNNTTITEWFKDFMGKDSCVKNLQDAENFKKLGNNQYVHKQLKLALHYYNKCLRYVPQNNAIYALTVANRSAVHYEMGNYTHCINDINIALKLDYPNHLRPKLYIRKAECHAYFGEMNLMNDSKEMAFKLINTCNIEPKMQEKHLKLLQNVRVQNHGKRPPDNGDMDAVNFEKSSNYLNASSSVRIDYNPLKGRHVIANKDIKVGDILFKEKAFAFAPVFPEGQELVASKCYYCLRDVLNPIYCKSCIGCEYCTEDCCNKSWNESHKYECCGLRNNFWYEIGIGFPVFRALLKGKQSNFRTIELSYETDRSESNIKFGTSDDNYPYFNTLLTNMETIPNITPLLLTASVLVVYLRDNTTFFDDISQCKMDTKYDLQTFVGGRLVKHIAQFTTNSSIIIHWGWSKDDVYFKNKSVDVACGIYPSVSMMNHSCKPQISMYYLGDVVVIKAIKDIEKGEEIFNCYGIDYRFMEKEQRRESLSNLYSFVCNCEVCSDSVLEVDYLDSFLCMNCEGPVRQLRKSTTGTCLYCKMKIDVSGHLRMETKIDYLQNCVANNLKQIDDLHDLLKDNYYRSHQRFERCFLLYIDYYKSQKNFNLTLRYIDKYINLIRYRDGENTRDVGVKQLLYAIGIIDDLTKKASNSHYYRDIINKLESLTIESKRILSFYYPASAINLNKVDNFFNANKGVK